MPFTIPYFAVTAVEDFSWASINRGNMGMVEGQLDVGFFHQRSIFSEIYNYSVPPKQNRKLIIYHMPLVIIGKKCKNRL